MIEAGAPSLPDLWNRAVLALTDASSEKLGHVLQELIQVNLPLADKYREVDVLSVLRDNASQQGLNAIATAFNILEKYGRNLLSPNKPKFWRAVKFNNPVFKSTVDAVKGGRDILRLYGYTVELRDGMSFPENVADPDPCRVAAVTVEVALLQVELDLLRKGTHPHPELFSQLLSTGTQVQQATPLTPSVQDPRPKADGAVTPTWTIESPPSSSGVPSGGGPWTPLQEEGVAKGGRLPIPASPGTSCAVCSAELVSSHCRDCGLLFCRDCGALPPAPGPGPAPALPHPAQGASPGASHREVQNGEVVSLGKEPEIRATPNQTLAWSCPGCQLSNPGQGLVCRGCQLPRASREPPPPSRAAWSCQACTCLNEASSVLCSACDRPRLAGRPSFTPRPPASSIAPALAPNPDPSPTPRQASGYRSPLSQCSNGFIYDGNQKQVTCPQCQGSFCVECKRPWEPQHQGISCEEFQSWKRENDPEYQAQGLAAYLKENGIDCPKCKFRYALARGGCMHFTCSQCQHEFCSGCYNAFLGKKKCNDPACRLKDSLHAHHPRDCLSYLRDWPVTALQELLQKHGVNFDTVPPAGAEATPGGNCRVMEQREDHGKLIDEACGKEACQGHAGLCESHYKEYLVSRINGHSLDPAHLYTVEEMEVFLNRMGKQQAPQATTETEVQYKARLLNVITAIPLGDKVPRIRK
ncbi:LOW QUALITY PROTEIN: E3 ubiquitin-protein ligase RNF31-like [Mobula birostris]|uniref:LOW QUALITY PROTEIN: E3 ubiquitin-protein ligase RNF31-like n=1 Tax=Mobula birostris TaxID=1983395 RepID=UPI003B27C11E